MELKLLRTELPLLSFEKNMVRWLRVFFEIQDEIWWLTSQNLIHWDDSFRNRITDYKKYTNISGNLYFQGSITDDEKISVSSEKKYLDQGTA